MYKTDWKGKAAIVLGLGVSGRSAAQFLLNRGARVIGVDRNPLLASTDDTIAALCRQGMNFFPEGHPLDISQFNLLVVSPGIAPHHPIYEQAMRYHVEIIGEIELACREIRQTCLGVTGTNGKTTVTLLTTHVLKEAGKKVQALGNIGLPLTSALDTPELKTAEIFVIELSSFQLETLTAPCLDAAVILNITPDHLDRYTSMNEYALAKVSIERNIKKNGRLFVEESCFKEFGTFFRSFPIYTYGYSSDHYFYTDKQHVFCEGKPLFPLPKLYQNKHSHDVENIVGSYALCSTFGISTQDFLNALDSFQKPSHRIEFIKTIGGIHYYDDSKGTNIDAVIRAVEGLNGNIILIAGGVDKGFPYTPWIKAFHKKVKAICAIGQAKEKMKKELGDHLQVALCTDLQHAVDHAKRIAEAGDTILLSPGCSSFDMFKDYAHRGQEFQRIVNAIKEN